MKDVAGWCLAVAVLAAFLFNAIGIFTMSDDDWADYGRKLKADDELKALDRWKHDK